LKEHKEKKFVDIIKENLEFGKLWSSLYLEPRIFSVSASMLFFSLLNESAICNNFLHRFLEKNKDKGPKFELEAQKPKGHKGAK
jgi:hypothetical protein